MKKIALVVGHRKSSQGAYGANGMSEYVFYKALSKEVKLASIGSDFEVEIFERSDELSGYTARMKELHKRIDEWGADVSISLHFNASSNKNANGHEVLYCSKKGFELAKKMNNIFSKNLKNRDRGVKKVSLKNRDRGAGFVCRGKSACILVEPFFASNIKFYENGKGREALIKSLLDFMHSISV